MNQTTKVDDRLVSAGAERRRCPVLLCLLLCLLNSGGQTLVQKTLVNTPPWGDRTSLPASEAPLSADEKLRNARMELAAHEESATNAPAGVAPEEIATKRALNHRLVWLLEQQVSNEQQLKEAIQRKQAVTAEAKAWSRFTESPPYSVLLGDSLREELQSERIKSASEETTLATIDLLIAENRSELDHAEEQIRQLNERLESLAEPVASARVTWQRDLQRLCSKVAASGLAVLEGQGRLRREISAESHARMDLLRRKLVIAEAGASFTQTDMEIVTARIDRTVAKLDEELLDATLRLRALTNELAAAKAVLPARTEAGSEPESSVTGLSSADDERVAALEKKAETARGVIRVVRLLQELESIERIMWEMRYSMGSSRSASALNNSERRLEAFERRLALWMEYPRHELLVCMNQIKTQEDRVREADSASPALAQVRAGLDALYEKDQLLQRVVRRIEQMQRMCQRWADALREAKSSLPLAGRAQNLFSDTGSFFRKLWSFELLTAEDTIEVDGQRITGKRSVTLGKILMAVGIFVLGIWIIGRLSRVAEPIIVRRLSMEANQARLIRRWVQALLVVCLTVFSLLSVKIPLTVFAFAGGALAIGLGFGTQTLLKNFVSGLILLFERPFRVGDVLDVAGSRGRVTEIGLRSSVLQLWDGTETLIPNSSLLENNVSNWTYSNRKVRFSVTVGVAYGSDARRVTKLLEEVLSRHGVIEKNPPPQVLFTDFGDSALVFELRYWVDVITQNSAQVASDLRQMITGAFADNGISIPFPQRDLNVNLKSPAAVPGLSQPQARVVPDPSHPKQ